MVNVKFSKYADLQTSVVDSCYFSFGLSTFFSIEITSCNKLLFLTHFAKFFGMMV